MIPSHLNPKIGNYRTDAPAKSWLVVLAMVTVALSTGVAGFAFDVTAAFLSGIPIKPERLCRTLKGALGLTEAPRLWYLRAGRC